MSNEDGRNCIGSLLKCKLKAQDMGTLGFKDSDAKRLLLLNRVFRVGTDQTGQFLDIERDLRHVPFKHRNSEHATKVDLQDKSVSGGRRVSFRRRKMQHDTDLPA